MDPTEQLLAGRACERLILDLVHRLDLGEPSSVAELFTGLSVIPMGPNLPGPPTPSAHPECPPRVPGLPASQAALRVLVTGR